MDQLVALNDELAALARAGVPLEQGLAGLGGDVPGRLGRISTALSQRLQDGESLPEALERETNLPPAYQAVVAAGLRSGRLAVALEGVSSVVRRAAETRRMVLVAWVYPLCVLLLAYGLFLFTLLKCQPAILAAYDGMLRRPETFGPLRTLIQTAACWAPWFPVVVLVAWGGWWLRARSAWSLEGRRSWPVLSRRFALSHMQQAGRLATFADCLALLVEQGVPLPEAIPLAADASGDSRLRASGQELAKRLASGEIGAGRLALPTVPPVLAWLLATPSRPEHLVRALRRVAASQQRRARWISHWLSVYLPLWLTTGVGGVAVALYAVTLIAPWARILVKLGQP